METTQMKKKKKRAKAIYLELAAVLRVSNHH